MTLKYLRTKVVDVQPEANGNLKVSWRLIDDLSIAEVTLIIEPPELEIIKAEARWERNSAMPKGNEAQSISRIEGISIGPGLRKILAGLLTQGNSGSCLMDAVLECGNAVILHYTRPRIEQMESISDPDAKLEATREWVKSNPRLVRSCISFQDDSPIMKGLDL
ncbi:MAG: hypothetical protein V1897_02870 [Pseudomonadota bacterium]